MIKLKLSIVTLILGLLIPLFCFANDKDLMKPLIFGGNDVKADSPIAATTVFISGDENGHTFSCSGSIVGADLILTAGHCLGRLGHAKLSVYFGLNKDINAKIIEVIGQVRKQETFPSPPNSWNDIALLRLASSIPAGHKPANILDDPSLIQNGAAIILAGYGRNVAQDEMGENPGMGILRFVDQKILEAHYASAEILVSLQNKGACFGDSGGPAYIQRGNDLLLFGVTSHLTENDRIPGTPRAPRYGCLFDMVYTDILAQAEWLKAVTAELYKK